MSTILILAYALVYGLLVKLRPDWALMLLIAVLPSYLIRFSLFGLPLTLLELMILISFAGWLIFKTNFGLLIRGKYSLRQFKQNRRQRLKYPFAPEIVLLLLVSYLAVAVSGFSDSALGVWKAYFFEPVLLFIVVLNVFKGKSGVNKLLWSLALSASLVAALAIIQKFSGLWLPQEWAEADPRRVTSFFGYPNAVGLYLGPLVMVMLGWLVLRISNFQFPNKLQITKTIFIAVTILLSLSAIYFARSEGALIAVGVGLIIFALVAGKKFRRARLILMLFLAAGVMLIAPVRNYAADKLLLRDLSGQIRRAQWQETALMLKDGRLLLGAGLANYQRAVAPYHQEGIFVRDYRDPDWHRKTVFNADFRNQAWQPLEIYLYPHNILLNFWVELGLFGMLLFIWLIIKFMYLGFINIRNWKLEIRNLEMDNKYLVLGLICAMVVIVVHGLVDVPYFKNDLAVMFWLLLALMSLLNLALRFDKMDAPEKANNHGLDRAGR